MSGFNGRPIALNYSSTKNVTVSASATTPQPLVGTIANPAEPTGPIQVRIVNYDTVKVAFHFGTLAGATNIALATSPTLAPGATEVLTVMPNRDGGIVYWSTISAASPTGNSFEVTLGQGL